MIKDPERHRIEEQVIGQCLDGGHISCLDILSPANFSVELHKRLFAIIAELADSQVDIITVSRAYHLRYKELAAEQIVYIHAQLIHRGAHHYPLLLLEIDMREKFVKLLDGYRETSVKEEDFESAALWKECADHFADLRHDLFDCIGPIYRYIETHKPEETDEYRALMDAVPSRIDVIRKTKRFAQLVTNLKVTNSFQGQRTDMMNAAADLLIHLCLSAKVHPDLEQHLLHIKNELL